MKGRGSGGICGGDAAVWSLGWMRKEGEAVDGAVGEERGCRTCGREQGLGRGGCRVFKTLVLKRANKRGK